MLPAAQATHMEGLLKRLHRGVHRMWSDTSTRAQVLRCTRAMDLAGRHPTV